MHGVPVTPGSEWIIKRLWVDTRIKIIARCRDGPGWWAYVLETRETIRVRHAWQLLRPARAEGEIFSDRRD
jgi:hypothetical protein